MLAWVCGKNTVRYLSTTPGGWGVEPVHRYALASPHHCGNNDLFQPKCLFLIGLSVLSFFSRLMLRNKNCIQVKFECWYEPGRLWLLHSLFVWRSATVGLSIATTEGNNAVGQIFRCCLSFMTHIAYVLWSMSLETWLHNCQEGSLIQVIFLRNERCCVYLNTIYVILVGGS